MNIGGTQMKAIINLSSPTYKSGQTRLKDSLIGKTDADYFEFTDESEVGAPKHADNNYAFKVYAIEKIRNIGYTQVLWLDASIFAVSSVEPIFNLIKRHGHFAEDSGNNCGNWCNDRSLEYVGISRDEAMEVTMISSGVLGFNFNNETTNKFFESWKQSMLNGMFIGRWDNQLKTESQDERCMGHRHDQSLASLYLDKYNMWISKGNTKLVYATAEQEVADSVVFKAHGIS